MDAKLTQLENRQQLIDYLEAGCKPKPEWGLGTEHEKFGFTIDDLRPLPYAGKRSVRAMLEGLASEFDWQAIEEKGNIIALLNDKGAAISLEPGGQLELSGALLDNVHQTCDEVYTHLAQVKTIAEPLGIAFLGMGFQPKWKRGDTQWMPKGRYRIMREYMNTRGNLGQDMMSRTCTVQVNLDFSSEADMVRKFQVALALQPVATVLFANSPFVAGKPCGFVSYRSRVWEDTDPDRTGMLPFVFDTSMGFERYVDYMLDVPMYFVYRNGEYLDASGQSFRDFLAGTLPALPGEKPSAQDWENHLTTAFPEVRLKQYMEMRGADGGPWRKLCALPALWAGLLYESPVLDAAWDLVRDWSMEERLQLRIDAPKLGFNTMIRNRSMQSLALEVLEMASNGLTTRNRLNASGENETGYLETLFANVRAGLTPAENKLAQYHGSWNESVDPVYSECAY